MLDQKKEKDRRIKNLSREKNLRMPKSSYPTFLLLHRRFVPKILS